MNQIIDRPKTESVSEILMKLKVGGTQDFNMKHYRSVTSRVSSRDFKYKYPGAKFTSSVNPDGETFTMEREA